MLRFMILLSVLAILWHYCACALLCIKIMVTIHNLDILGAEL